jgi:hypothetical protein
VENEIQKFFGYVRTGIPMAGIIAFFMLMLVGIFELIPPLTIPVGTIIFIVFFCAALGIIKEIADK